MLPAPSFFPRTVVVACLVLVVLLGRAEAGPNSWTAPFQDVRALMQTPLGEIYAGTDGRGVFKSTDGGFTWAPSNNGLTNLFVFSLAKDEATPSTVYAGTIGGGVFRSTDGGASWAPFGTGLSGSALNVRAFEAGAPGALIAGTDAGLFLMMSGTTTWASTALTAPVRAFAGDGTRMWLWIATIANGVYTMDTTYSSVTQRINGLANLNMRSIAVDQVSGTVYAGTTRGAYKTTDGGATWTAVSNGLPAPGGTLDAVRAITVDEVTPTVLYAGTSGNGVYKSTDSGASWTGVNSGLRGLKPLLGIYALVSQGPDVLLAATAGGGVYMTMNATTLATWTASNDGFTRSKVRGLVWDATTVLWIATDDGLFQSADAGNTISSALHTPVTSVSYNSSSGAGLFIGTASGIARSSDNGATWVAPTAGPSGSSGSVLSWAGTPGLATYAGTNGAGVWRSTNANSAPYSFAQTPLNTATVYRLDLAVPAAPNDNLAHTIVYAATSGGMWKSTNGGDSFVLLPNLTSVPQAVAIDPTDTSGNTLYAGTSGGVFKSTDGGGTWAAQNSGLGLPVPVVTALIFKSGTLYAGTQQSGGFMARTVTSGSMSWIPLNNPPAPVPTVTSAVMSQVDNTLFVGVADSGTEGGVYSLTMMPDLAVGLTNDFGGAVPLGIPFNWIISVDNSNGLADATFPAGATILRDTLPTSGVTYGTPVVTNSTVVGTVSCAITAGDLVCTAGASGTVTLGAASGRFDVEVPATPTALGSLMNPRAGGMVRVDPDNNIADADRSNNDAAADVVLVQPVPTVTLVVHDASHNVITTASVGSSVHAYAGVAGSAGPATGLVVFISYPSQNCTGVGNLAGFVTISNGAAESTAAVVPSGGLSFIASYTGDATYGPAVSNCAAVSTGRATPTMAADVRDAGGNAISSAPAGTAIHGRAALSGSSGTPTGNVVFGGYATSSCSGTPLWTDTQPLIAGVANSAATTVPATDFYFQAAYAGDSAYNAITSACTLFHVASGGPVFTDNPIAVGATPIKIVHITELRQAIDTLRSRYGLSAFSWTDPTLTAHVTQVKVAHLTELRTALAAVYAAAGQTPPTYTDPTITSTTVIKQVHIAELRAAVLAIW
jgi:photosystem II stability/assembly factor-like uncharacterized protein